LNDRMSDHLVIRTALPGDLDEVRRLLVTTWHDTYDALLGADRVTATTDSWHAIDVLAGQSALPNASFLIATRCSKLVGHAFAIEEAGGVLFLSRLYVLPSHQRQGIGQSLLAAAIKRHPGTACVHLIVEARNTKGLAFYGRHGFVVIGEIEEEGSRPLHLQMAVGA